MTDLVFGPCRLSLVQRRLFVLNQPIELGARSFDLLLALLERPGFWSNRSAGPRSDSMSKTAGR